MEKKIVQGRQFEKYQLFTCVVDYKTFIMLKSAEQRWSCETMRFCTIGIKIHYPSDEVSHAALTSKVDATLIIRDYTISFFVL